MHPIRFGIIGNMGPEADELFQRHLRTAMNIRRDQDALPMVVVKNPAIPDRTQAIVERGPSPVEESISSCRLLEACGVRFAVMPCNTAHHFRNELQRQTSVYLVDMLAIVLDHINALYAGMPIGLLATNGTVRAGLYQRYAARYGISLLTLPQDLQERWVHAAIYGSLTERQSADGGELRQSNGIKSGCYDEPIALLSHALHFMQDRGVTIVILGCTELPLVEQPLKSRFPGMTFIDPMQVTAAFICKLYRAAVQWRDEYLGAVPAIYNPQDIQTWTEMVAYIAAETKQEALASCV